MSKLIDSMLISLFQNNGQDIDDAILSSVNTGFNPALTEANCLTSEFMFDIDKSIEDGFLSNCEDQNGYNKKLEGKVFEKARAFANDFDSKDFKKVFRQASDITKYQAAIERNLAGFQDTFGNELFENSLAKVAEKMPNENLACQIVTALVESKANAQNNDVDRIVEIEKSCKPLVYAMLRKTKDYQTAKDFQDRVIDYFRQSRNTRALDYLRQVSITNLIKTKVPNDIYLNTNVSETNQSNSLLTVGGYGYQMYLINGNDPDRHKDMSGLKITDLVKESSLFNGNQLSRNSKNIQKAFEMINAKVNAFKGGKDKPVQDRENFLQSAIVFMLLANQADLQDPLDLIGIAIANPVSDIIYMSEKNKIYPLVKEAFQIADSISRDELGTGLANNQAAKAVEQSEPNISPAELSENDIDASSQGQIVPQEHQAEKNYTGTNVRAFYKLMTSKVVEVLSKNLPRMMALEDELAQNGEFSSDLTARKKLRKNGFTAEQKYDMFQALTELYGSSKEMLAAIDDLKSMHSDMDSIANKLTNQIKRGQDFKLRKKELVQLHLDDEQAKSRLEKYQAYFTFVKTLDPTKRVTLDQILEIKNQPENPLNGILKYLDLPSSNKEQTQTVQKTTEPASENINDLDDVAERE